MTRPPTLPHNGRVGRFPSLLPVVEFSPVRDDTEDARGRRQSRASRMGSLFLALVFEDQPVLEVDHTVSVFGDVMLMRDQHDGIALGV